MFFLFVTVCVVLVIFAGTNAFAMITKSLEKKFIDKNKLGQVNTIKLFGAC